MNNYSKLYWFTRLDTIHGLFLAACIISGFVFIGYHIAFSTSWEEESYSEWNKKYGSFKRWAIGIFIFSLPFCLFVPTKNDAILIIAGGKTMDFVEKDTSINKIPAQTTKLITDYLQDALKGTKDK